jgi:hypothetical protein
MGVIAEALRSAQQSVTYADLSGDDFIRAATRTVHADVLHQAGHRDEGEARFREAEEMQAAREPRYPLLYSVSGFRYCDLLLSALERAAWQSTLHSSFIPSLSSLADSSHVVAERAVQTLKWYELNNEQWLLDIALDHLTSGRSALYEAILTGSSLATCQVSLQRAADGLRRAGHQDELPKAPLSRAWLRSLTGNRVGAESAQSDLDEAWEIAERGPMQLFMADIHLHRARLFGLAKDVPYPWTSAQTDLAEARRLIEKHGYWRRKEELEDAEAVLLPGA